MQFSRIAYSSSFVEPSLPASLHVIARCNLLQAEAQVVEQKAKRRGGPKKVWLQYALLDAAGRVSSTHVLVWKTISTKNFSNRANIEQYERNPFGIMTAGSSAAAGAGDAAFALVLSGVNAVAGKGPSNTVGVNVRGKDVANHPRFVLSTGKDIAGARTLLTFYHSDASVRVQLQALWIEHRELKVAFENIDDAPLLEFASKPAFKTIYAARPADDSDALVALTAETNRHPVAAAAPPAAATPAVKQADLFPPKPRAGLSTRRSSASRRALPPAVAPPHVAELLRKRSRSMQEQEQELEQEQNNHPDEPQAGDLHLSAAPMLTSPVAQHGWNHDQQQHHDQETDAVEPSAKRAASDAAAAGHHFDLSFAGFEQGFVPQSGLDDMNGGAAPMLDVLDSSLLAHDAPLLQPADLAEPDYSQQTDDSQLLEDDSQTPSSSARTPYRSEECAAAVHMAAFDQSPDASCDELEQEDLSVMHSVLNEAENAEGKYQPSESQLFNAMAAAKAAPAEVPLPLATAHAAGNPFAFTAFDSSAANTNSHLLQLPSAFSPEMRFFSERSRSPLQLLQSSSLSPLLASSYAAPHSPYFSPLADLHCSNSRGSATQAAVAPGKSTPLRALSSFTDANSRSSWPGTHTPVRQPSA